MLEASSVLDRSSRRPKSNEAGSNLKVWQLFEAGENFFELIQHEATFQGRCLLEEIRYLFFSLIYRSEEIEEVERKKTDHFVQ